jgi:NADPH:quinone reductase-like Zn-dependent oxidoreductase
MKAAVLEAFGLQNLRYIDWPEPVPGPGQLLVKLTAVSLNHRDWMMVDGRYNPRQPLPLIPASDGVGKVVALGEGVSEVNVGARVCPIFAQKWLQGKPTRAQLKSALGGPLHGTLAQYIVVDAEGIVRPPEHLTDLEAACLPCAAVTAYSALVSQGGLSSGQSVLTLGTGGVSIFALQFAKLLGARAIITSGSEEKLARAAELGADDLINYGNVPEWGRRVRELTAGEGVDHVIEVGGAGTFEQSLRGVRPGGQISVIGVLAGSSTSLNLTPILMQNIRVQGVVVGPRQTFDAMNEAIRRAHLRPVIDRVFSLREVTAAFEYLASGRHFGKVAIEID